MQPQTRKAGSRKDMAIVVGTDFSPASSDVIARATLVAKATGATVHVVHASPKIPRALARFLGDKDDRVVLRALEACAAKVRAAGVRVHTYHVVGRPTDALCAKAREVRAALVVVGARGRTVPDATIGSTAERVVAASRTPVLLVRRSAGQSYREVVIGADVDTDLREAMAAARLVAPAARITVVHAFTAPWESALRLQGATAAEIQSYRRHARSEASEAMAKVFAKAGEDPSMLALRLGDPRRVLTRIGGGTLLVLNRGRSFLRHALIGSVSRWVIAYGTSDVLLV